jgi:hypothetical protein
MYNKVNMKKRIFRSTALLIFASVSIIYAQRAGSDTEEIDPVLQFYINQADSVFRQTNVNDSNLHYSFMAFTYYKSIGRHGVVARLDSTVSRYFCTGSKIDSSQILVEPQHSIPEITISYPNVFTDYFEHKFFPNDVGDIELAIGFDNPDVKDTLPTGIAIINRDNYVLHRLYLYYPNTVYYKRLTRSYRLSEFSGLIFPDSIWEVGAKQGIFSTEYYRLETEIGQLQFLK